MAVAAAERERGGLDTRVGGDYVRDRSRVMEGCDDASRAIDRPSGEDYETTYYGAVTSANGQRGRQLSK